MSGALSFLETVAGYATLLDPSRPAALGTIDPAYVSSSYPATLPKVTFDGESTLSGKRYPVVGPYWPTASDRVLLLPAGNTYVIAGALDSDAALRVGGALAVAGASTLTGNVTMSGTLGVTGTVTMSGAATVGTSITRASETWQSLSLATSWSGTLRVRRLATGSVEWEARLSSSGNRSDGTTIATLGVGYRPANSIGLTLGVNVMAGGTAQSPHFSVGTNGAMSCYGCGSATVIEGEGTFPLD